MQNCKISRGMMAPLTPPSPPEYRGRGDKTRIRRAENDTGE